LRRVAPGKPSLRASTKRPAKSGIARLMTVAKIINKIISTNWPY